MRTMRGMLATCAALCTVVDVTKPIRVDALVVALTQAAPREQG